MSALAEDSREEVREVGDALRQPFRGDDQIQVGDVSGTVEEINVRETVIRTFDGAILQAFDAEGILLPAEIVAIRPSPELQELDGSSARPAARTDKAG